MYRIKGIKRVQVKDSCLFERVRIVFSRSPLFPLTDILVAYKMECSVSVILEHRYMELFEEQTLLIVIKWLIFIEDR